MEEQTDKSFKEEDEEKHQSSVSTFPVTNTNTNTNTNTSLLNIQTQIQFSPRSAPSASVSPGIDSIIYEKSLKRIKHFLKKTHASNIEPLKDYETDVQLILSLYDLIVLEKTTNLINIIHIRYSGLYNYYVMWNRTNAIRILNEGITMRDPYCACYLALIFEGIKAYTKAEDLYLKAIEFGFFNTYTLLGSMKYKQKMLEDAEYYFMIGSNNYNIVSSMFELAKLYVSQGRSRAAAKYYLKAIDLKHINSMTCYAHLCEKKLKDKNETEKYLLLAYNTSLEINDVRFMNITRKNLILYYKTYGQHKEAEQYGYTKKFSCIIDTNERKITFILFCLKCIFQIL